MMSQYFLYILSTCCYCTCMLGLFFSIYVSGLWLDNCKDRTIMDLRKSNAVSETRTSCVSWSIDTQYSVMIQS